MKVLADRPILMGGMEREVEGEIADPDGGGGQEFCYVSCAIPDDGQTGTGNAGFPSCSTPRSVASVRVRVECSGMQWAPGPLKVDQHS